MSKRVLVKASFDHRAWEGTVIQESNGDHGYGSRTLLVAPDSGAAVWRDPDDCKEIPAKPAEESNQMDQTDSVYTVLATFRKTGAPLAQHKAHQLVNVLKEKFPDLKSGLNVLPANPGWQVTYIPALTEDVEETIDSVHAARNFAEGYHYAVEESP